MMPGLRMVSLAGIYWSRSAPAAESPRRGRRGSNKKAAKADSSELKQLPDNSARDASQGSANRMPIAFPVA